VPVVNRRDAADTFDAEIRPDGTRRPYMDIRPLVLCVNCGTQIEQPNRDIGLRYWAHPDLYDVDCDGVMCPDDEDNVAEPAAF